MTPFYRVWPQNKWRSNNPKKNSYWTIRSTKKSCCTNKCLIPLWYIKYNYIRTVKLFSSRDIATTHLAQRLTIYLHLVRPFTEIRDAATGRIVISFGVWYVESHIYPYLVPIQIYLYTLDQRSPDDQTESNSISNHLAAVCIHSIYLYILWVWFCSVVLCGVTRFVSAYCLMRSDDGAPVWCPSARSCETRGVRVRGARLDRCYLR